MTSRSLTLGQGHSRVPSSTSSTTASSFESTTADSDDSYDTSTGTMFASNSDGSQEELTMTPARLHNRQRSIAMPPAQTYQSVRISHTHQGYSSTGSWPLLQQILLLDRIAAEKKAAAKAEENAFQNGDFLLKLLDTKGFDREFAKELRTVINMVKHMNILLFKDKNGTMDWKINPDMFKVLGEVTIQVLHYFDQLGNGLNRAIDKIHEVKRLLPNLGPRADPWDLRVKLNIWNARLMRYVKPSAVLNRLRGADSCYSTLVAPVRKREKLLFEGLVEFYYAMIYHSFLRVREINPEHDMCKFSAEFTSIYEGLNFLNDAYTTIDLEMHKFGFISGAARDRLLSTPEALDDQYLEQIEHHDVLARNAKATQALTDAANAFTVMRSSSTSTIDSFDSAIKGPNTEVRATMTTMTKEEEAEEDRQFEAAIDVLMKEKLEREAAMAKAAAEAKKAAMAEAAGRFKATVAEKSKPEGRARSSASIVQAMRKIKEHQGKGEPSFSSFLTMRRIRQENVPLQKSSTV